MKESLTKRWLSHCLRILGKWLVDDGAYDRKGVFKFMKETGAAIPGIKIRKNVVIKSDFGKS